jgi:hypothetical protein
MIFKTLSAPAPKSILRVRGPAVGQEFQGSSFVRKLGPKKDSSYQSYFSHRAFALRLCVYNKILPLLRPAQKTSRGIL